MFRRLLTPAVLLSLIFSLGHIAQADTPSDPGLVVDHVAGGVEKVKEKLTLFFNFKKEDKARYRQYLTEKRLAELKYVVDTNQIDSIEPVASRYSTYAGLLTNFVVKEEIKTKRDDLLTMFERHRQIVEELQKGFKFESGWWLMLQHNINVTKLSSDQLKTL
ncbi:MAG: DUF5667 domain-containing protein [bacterium]|nr:DUF5667 domain-containing protein [bacterium]